MNDTRRYFGILINCGEQTIRAFGIQDRIPCCVDTKISEANPEFGRQRISTKAMAEDTESNAGRRAIGAKYSGGPYSYDYNHTPEVLSK